MRYEAAGAIAPGVVCRDVVVGWLHHPIWVVRPRSGALENRTLASEAAAYPPPFVDGEDDLLATAKRRPVLVVASKDELRIALNIRVIPIHKKGDKRFFNEHWDRIVAGNVAGLVAMPDGRPAFGFDEGVLDLTAAQRIHRAFLPNAPWFQLDRGSLTGVVRAMERLLRTSTLS